jgi:hypothetical protein
MSRFPLFVNARAWGAGIWVLAASASPVRAEFIPQFQPTLRITRTAGAIKVDGDLDDPGWKDAVAAENFTEFNPGDQVEPPVQSRVLVTYDDINFYVALIAEDDPTAVRVSLRDRDRIFTDDYFGVMIDTYGEQAWAYELFVNPYGIQGDLRMLTSGEEEIGFDIVWESAGEVTESGYQVEIAIPFASLRFPKRPEQRWRINFWRDRQRDVRGQYSWAAMDRDNPCFMCQWGTLTGIRDIRPGKNIEIIATAVGSQAGALEDGDDPGSPFDNHSVDGDASLNLRYGLSSNASTEITLNPDFSQVESDVGQIDVNSTFALFYPEKRPFFQEGSDQYSTWISAIYTRSLNDPSVAAKLSGQYGKANLTYTFGRDEHSPLILPFEEQSEFVALGKSVSNIARARYSIKDDTYVGALVTDRRVDDGGAGTVAGGDANARFLENYVLEFQALASHTEEPEGVAVSLAGDPDSIDTFDAGRHTADLDGEAFWGYAQYASLERSARTWNFDLDYWAYSPTFRTDNGFTTSNDARKAIAWSGLTFRPNGKVLVRWDPSASAGRVWNWEGRFKDEWIQPQLNFGFKGQTDFQVQGTLSNERFGNRQHDGIRRLEVVLESTLSAYATAGIWTRFGRGVYRSFSDPQLGNEFFLSLWGQLKPHQRLVVEPSWDYAQMRSRVDDSLLFKTYILRTRFGLNLTRKWYLRLIVQYKDGTRRLDLEPLLTYRLNPFSVFYVGVNGKYRRFDVAPASGPVEKDWELASRQFFVKFQYLFRM